MKMTEGHQGLENHLRNLRPSIALGAARLSSPQALNLSKGNLRMRRGPWVCVAFQGGAGIVGFQVVAGIGGAP